MPDIDFEKLNNLIRKSGANWQAGPTSVSQYYGVQTDAGGGRFGLRFDPTASQKDVTKARRNEPNLFKVAVPPPARIDWRNHGSKNYVTRIKNQGSLGTCVAFAVCACLESRTRIALGKANHPIDLSEAHLFACGDGDWVNGWYADSALKLARTMGIGKEADLPYTGMIQACQKIKPVVKVKSFINASSTIARKQALMLGPVVAGMQVFDDFLTYQSGVYRHVSGDSQGWHAISVVGYNDAEGCWIAKNSWGADFGEAGFFRIAYGECGIDTSSMFQSPDITVVSNQPADDGSDGGDGGLTPTPLPVDPAPNGGS